MRNKVSKAWLIGLLMLILSELAAVSAVPAASRRKRNIDVDRAFEIVNIEHQKHESKPVIVDQEQCALECPVNSNINSFGFRSMSKILTLHHHGLN
jgi:hypothetical protein